MKSKMKITLIVVDPSEINSHSIMCSSSCIAELANRLVVILKDKSIIPENNLIEDINFIIFI